MANHLVPRAFVKPARSAAAARYKIIGPFKDVGTAQPPGLRREVPVESEIND
jgi:hypothetical protein